MRGEEMMGIERKSLDERIRILHPYLDLEEDCQICGEPCRDHDDGECPKKIYEE
jgi:hypothetical protein